MLSRLTLVAAATAVLASSLVAQAAAPYRVYVTDRTNQVVRAYNEAGTELSGATFASPNFVSGIWGVAADTANQKLFVSQENSGTVTRLNANGSLDSTFALTDGTTTSTFALGMDVGADGNLYALGGNVNGYQLWKVNAVTSSVSLLSTDISGQTYDLVAGTDGVYVLEKQNVRVKRFSTAGPGSPTTVISYVDGQTAPQLDDPFALDFDQDGKLTVLDLDRFPDAQNSTGEYLIRHFALNPVSDTGPTWSGLQENQNSQHFGLAVAPDGRTFVTSFNDSSALTGGVVVFSSTGTSSNFASGYLSTQVDVLLLPEPASAALTGLGMVLLAGRRRRA